MATTEELVENVRESYETLERYFNKLSETAADDAVVPPMAYWVEKDEELFLASLDTSVLEEGMLRKVKANASLAESGIQDSILACTPITRDLGIRNMSRADYYEDSKMSYIAERDYYEFKKDLNLQYISASTPKQRV